MSKIRFLYFFILLFLLFYKNIIADFFLLISILFSLAQLRYRSIVLLSESIHSPSVNKSSAYPDVMSLFLSSFNNFNKSSMKTLKVSGELMAPYGTPLPSFHCFPFS